MNFSDLQETFENSSLKSDCLLDAMEFNDLQETFENSSLKSDYCREDSMGQKLPSSNCEVLLGD